MRRTALRRVSVRKAARAAHRRRVVMAVRDRAHGRCEGHRFMPHTCSGPLDAHELIPRSVWRDGDLDADNVVLICRALHDWIHHQHPAEARAAGLLRP